MSRHIETESAVYFAEEATRPVQADIPTILEKLRMVPEFFIQFFMAELLVYPVPPFHIEIFSKMISSMVKKLALAIPRGHNKTTLAKLAVIYQFLFTDYYFIVYASSTVPIAQAACNDIIAFMRNENFKAVFGDIDFKFDLGIERAGEGLYIFRFKHPITGQYKICILRALGAGQQVRGLNIHNRRPEMFVVDDLEDNEIVESETLQARLKRWVYGPFLKSANKWKLRIIWLGNWLSNNCILKDLHEDTSWESYRWGCIKEDGQPLWPDMLSLQDIKEDYENYVKKGQEDIWFAEMMNMIVPRRDGVIRHHELYYLPPPDPLLTRYTFITIDPAISAKKWAHKCGIIVHAYNELHQVWQVVDGHIERGMSPMKIYEKTMELAKEWNVKVIGIELVAYQAALKFFFEHLLAEYAGHSIEIVGLPAGERKVERISAWCGSIKQKRYAMTEGNDICTVLEEQVLNFNPTSKANDDDGIDAAAHGEHVVINYIGLIQSKFTDVTEDMNQPVWLGHKMAV